MPITLDFNPDDGFVRATVAGDVTADDFKTALAHILESPEIPSDVPTLYDMRDMSTTRLNFSQALSLMTYRRTIDTRRTRVRVAFLVGSDTVYGMVRMWQNLTQDEPGMTAQRGIFRNEAEAISWMQPPSSS